MILPAVSIAAVLAASPTVPYEAEIGSALAETAAIYPVPRTLVIAVISVESGFRPRVVSPAGAKGLMQLMPYTARRLGIAERDLWNPAKNVLGGTRLLAVLLRHYDGDVVSALVAYNARPRRLLAPLPQNGETPTCVWRVLARARAFSAAESRLGRARGTAHWARDPSRASTVRAITPSWTAAARADPIGLVVALSATTALRASLPASAVARPACNTGSASAGRATSGSRGGHGVHRVQQGSAR